MKKSSNYFRILVSITGIFLMSLFGASLLQAQVSISWPLSTNLTPTVSGAQSATVSASNATFTAGTNNLFTGTTVYGAGGLTGTGVTGKAASSCNAAYNGVSTATPYMEFSLAPVSGYNLSLNSFSLAISGTSIGSGVSVAMGYSTDGGTTFYGFGAPSITTSATGTVANVSPVGSPFTSSTGSSAAFSFSRGALSVKSDSTLKIRVVVWRNNASGSSGTTITIGALSLTGTTSIVPSVTFAPTSLTGFSATTVAPSPAKSFTTAGVNLTSSVTLTAPSDFQISRSSGSGYQDTLILGISSGTLSSTTIYTRIKSGLSLGAKSGAIAASATGFSGASLAVSGNVYNNIYYSTSTDLSQTSSWNTLPNGMGSSPSDFTGTNTTYNVITNNCTLSSNLTLDSLSGSKLIVGDGAGTGSFTIPASAAYSGYIDVVASSNLTIQNNTLTDLLLGALDSLSTVQFDGSGVQILTTNSGHSNVNFGILEVTNPSGLRLGTTTTVRNLCLVKTGGKLVFGLSSSAINMQGTGRFTTEDGSSLTVTSSAGLVSGSTSSGNLRTSGTRTFSASTSFTYTSNSTAPVLGTGFPTTCGDLTIDLTAGNAYVLTLTSNFTVNNLVLTTGKVALQSSSRTLTINGNLSVQGAAILDANGGTINVIGNASNPGNVTNNGVISGSVTGSSFGLRGTFGQQTYSGSKTRVTGATVTAGGSGYTTATVAISGDGSGATANAVISGGTITGISITSGGSGYTTASISITGDGIDATATALLNSNTMGTATAAFDRFTVRNVDGAHFNSGINNVVLNRFNAFMGSITGTEKITLGTGSGSNPVIQRGFNALEAAGTFDVSPVYNMSSGALSIVYGTALSQVTAGAEIPSDRKLLKISSGNPNGLVVTDNLTVDSLLLSAGNVKVASTKNVFVTVAVSKTGNAWVVGGLQKNIGTGASSATFEVGEDSLNYTPVSVTFGTVTSAGTLTANAKLGTHPNQATSGISNSKLLNYYYSLDNSGVVFDYYSATFNFINPGSISGAADPTAFIVSKYSAGWTLPTVGTKTSSSTQVTGVTSFSDFVIGEVTPCTPTTSTTTTSICTNDTASFMWNDVHYGSAGTYTVHLTNALGCDSAATLVLSINPTSGTDTVRLAACSTALPFLWNGGSFTAAGTYTNVTALYNVNGCDSTAVLVLSMSTLKPAQPATPVATLVSNACGARVYRYSVTAVPNATGYIWTLPTSVGGVSGVTVDSGDVNSSRVIRVMYASNKAAFLTDSIGVSAYSGCGTSARKSIKLTNLALNVPAAPTAILITPMVTNVCGARYYRYTAPASPGATASTGAATGYIWSFTGLAASASIDSGDVNSRVIVLLYTSNAAAAIGDSVKVLYTSACGNSLNKAAKITNLALKVPAKPTAIVITPIVTNVCGARLYRYAAPALPAATASTGAATGYVWSFSGLAAAATIDSGDVNSRYIRLLYSSNAAAVAGDSVKVYYTSDCGNSLEKAAKITNAVLNVPAKPTAIVITPIVTNVCGARLYRYAAPALPAATASTGVATGYVWSFTGLASSATIDSGDVNSRYIRLLYSSNAAAAIGDSVKVYYTSACGNSLEKAAKITNAALLVPAAPGAIVITPIATNVCGARTYRYAAPALPAATATTGAATGYVWSFTGLASTGATLDSGTSSSRFIVLSYSSNAAAAIGDSVRVRYTSDCGNSLNKAMKISNLALAVPAPMSVTQVLVSDVCGARVYRYTASAVLATATSGAASGYQWQLPSFGGATLDSGDVNSSRIIKVVYTSNAASTTLDSIKVRSLSDCGNSALKGFKLSVTAKTGCPPAVAKAGPSAPLLSETLTKLDVSIYPNPSRGNFNIAINSSDKTSVAQVDITNEFGQPVYRRSISNNNGVIAIAVNNNLTNGIYMITCKVGSERVTKRIVINR